LETSYHTYFTDTKTTVSSETNQLSISTHNVSSHSMDSSSTTLVGTTVESEPNQFTSSTNTILSHLIETSSASVWETSYHTYFTDTKTTISLETNQLSISTHNVSSHSMDSSSTTLVETTVESEPNHFTTSTNTVLSHFMETRSPTVLETSVNSESNQFTISKHTGTNYPIETSTSEMRFFSTFTGIQISVSETATHPYHTYNTPTRRSSDMDNVSTPTNYEVTDILTSTSSYITHFSNTKTTVSSESNHIRTYTQESSHSMETRSPTVLETTAKSETNQFISLTHKVSSDSIETKSTIVPETTVELESNQYTNTKQSYAIESKSTYTLETLDHTHATNTKTTVISEPNQFTTSTNSLLSHSLETSSVTVLETTIKSESNQYSTSTNTVFSDSIKTNSASALETSWTYTKKIVSSEPHQITTSTHLPLNHSIETKSTSILETTVKSESNQFTISDNTGTSNSMHSSEMERKSTGVQITETERTTHPYYTYNTETRRSSDLDNVSTPTNYEVTDILTSTSLYFTDFIETNNTSALETSYHTYSSNTKTIVSSETNQFITPTDKVSTRFIESKSTSALETTVESEPKLFITSTYTLTSLYIRRSTYEIEQFATSTAILVTDIETTSRPFYTHNTETRDSTPTTNAIWTTNEQFYTYTAKKDTITGIENMSTATIIEIIDISTTTYSYNSFLTESKSFNPELNKISTPTHKIFSHFSISELDYILTSTTMNNNDIVTATYPLSTYSSQIETMSEVENISTSTNIEYTNMETYPYNTYSTETKSRYIDEMVNTNLSKAITTPSDNYSTLSSYSDTNQLSEIDGWVLTTEKITLNSTSTEEIPTLNGSFAEYSSESKNILIGTIPAVACLSAIGFYIRRRIIYRRNFRLQAELELSSMEAFDKSQWKIDV
jgi:hypothetical protein